MSASEPSAQRDVGQHLGRAGDDRRFAVDRGVAGQHADVGRAENLAEGEELFADQCLDRGGVKAAARFRGGSSQRCEQRARGHQRLARTGRRRQDDVGAADQLDQRLLLRRIQHGAVLLGPGGERREQLVGVGAEPFGDVGERTLRHLDAPGPAGRRSARRPARLRRACSASVRAPKRARYALGANWFRRSGPA